MAEIQQSISDALIDAESRYGQNVMKRPASILPKRPRENPVGSLLMDALLGAGAGIKAAAETQDPLAALALGASGALGAPRFEDIRGQRDAQASQAYLQELEAAPVESISPALVNKYPELRGLPLGMVQKIAPMLQRSEMLQARLEAQAAARGRERTPGQKALDVKFGKDYADFISQGGAADVRKNLSQLRGAADALESGKENLTGPALGRLSVENRTLLPGGARSSEVQQDVEDVVQRNLRLVLGAQFTEKEGDRLIARAYDPRLPEKTNARRLRRLILQIEDAAEAKEAAIEYFEENGTLDGFKGKLYASVDDFKLEGDEGRRDRSAPPPKKTSSGKAYVLEVIE